MDYKALPTEMERKGPSAGLSLQKTGSIQAPFQAPNAPSFHRLKTKDTITRPSADDNILCVAKVLKRHIAVGDSGNRDDDDKDYGKQWDIDRFIHQKYKVFMPSMAQAHPFCAYRQVPKKNKLPKPTSKNIYSFIKRFFDQAHLNPECAIISLIYAERLMETKSFSLTCRNWVPIVMMSLLTASKVWDDMSSWNIEFCEIFPAIPLRTMNFMEREFLGALSYNLYIKGSMYAEFYFGLRALRQVANPRGIGAGPRNYLAARGVPSQIPPRLGGRKEQEHDENVMSI